MAIIRAYTIDLPLGIGTRAVEFGRFTEENQEKTIAHGLTQKLGDLTAKHQVEPADPSKRKKGVKYYPNAAARKAAVEVAADALLSRLYAGEWNQDGSGRGISTEDGYRFSIIFGYLGIAAKDQASRRKAGIESLIQSYAIKKSGKSNIKGKALKAAIAATEIELEKKVELQKAIYS
jgi:hypothetical protein